MLSRRLAFIAVLLVAAQIVGFAESKPLELKWGELAPLITGRTVEVTLPNNARLRGEAVAVREGALLMDVHGVSGKTEFRKGNAEIPRNGINLIKLERSRGGWGKTMGTVIGVISGLTLGGWAAAHTNSANQGIPAFLGIASGVSVTGYVVGKEIDRKTTVIRVVP